MIYYWALLGAFLLLLECVTLVPDALEEYCETDTFRASCENGVILMKEARYGRMALGKCLKLDVGFMDCFSDVLPEMDKLCSGQPICEVQVNNLVTVTQPCPLEFRSYLQASYTCLPVVIPGPQCCHSQSDGVLVEADHGYIASRVTEELGCGTRYCPWKLRSSNSQTINLYILDFGYRPQYANIEERYPSNENCLLYAIIHEVTLGYTKRICAGAERRRHVHTTSSNSVEIGIVEQENTEKNQQKYFLVEFEAMGCADPIPPKHGSVERNGNHARITCVNAGDIIWEITCHKGQWSGMYGNCTDGSSPPAKTDDDISSRGTGLDLNMAVIIIVVVAVIVSTTLLVIGVVCIITKYSRSRPAHGRPTLKLRDGCQNLDVPNHAIKNMDQHLALYTDDNYVNTRDAHRNISCPTPMSFAEAICVADDNL